MCNDGLRKVMEDEQLIDEKNNLSEFNKHNFHQGVFDECNGVRLLFTLYYYYIEIVDNNNNIFSTLLLLELKYSLIIICSLHFQMENSFEISCSFKISVQNNYSSTLIVN
jgi:hypothetical protein